MTFWLDFLEIFRFRKNVNLFYFLIQLYCNLFILRRLNSVTSLTGNGYITTGVLREILKELDDKLTAQELDMMISEIDTDGSGTVDFDGKQVNWCSYDFLFFY